MIAVNLVSGFLGVGKTTLICSLLQRRPADEKWAVLVNEFGEVGVDAALLDSDGVAIAEVAGGCLCCVAAPAFSVGLNRLIREHRPDRILIEPSGLGHPAQLLETLRSPLYESVLQTQATLCVMDARHLQSPRHCEHPDFIDQIHLADVLVANKADCYSADDEQAFLAFAATLNPSKSRLLITQQGRISPALLGEQAQERRAAFPEAHAFLLQQPASSTPAPQAEWLGFSGEGDGYRRAGWLIGRSLRFDRQRLLAWLDALPVERVKGVLICSDGAIRYNRSTDAAEIEPVESVGNSRLQLIDPDLEPIEVLEAQLRECLS